MRLAKIIMIGFFILMLTIAALVVFLGGRKTQTTRLQSVTMTAEQSDEDPSYAQEIRTLTAKFKGVSEQMRRAREKSAQEQETLRRQIHDLERIRNREPSGDKQEDLALQMKILENRNHDLGQRNADLQARIADIEARMDTINAASAPVDAARIKALVDARVRDVTERLSRQSDPPDRTDQAPDLERFARADSAAGRVRHRPYGIEAGADTSRSGLIDQLAALTGAQNQDGNNPFATAVTQNQEAPQTVFPVYTLPVTTMLTDSTLLTPLVGRVPFAGNVNDPFKFQLVLGADNLAANGQRIPGVAKVIAAGTAIGNREQSCVRAAVHTMTFIFEDGRISTVDEGGSGSGSGITGLGYLADPWGKPCIRGQYINNASQYLKSRSMAAFLEGLANAYSQAQLTYDNDGNGMRSAYVSGNSYSYAASQGIGKTANEIADYVRERAADAFDVVYVPQAQKVQLIIERQIAIDYDKNARKISYRKQDQGVSNDD